MEGAVVAGVGSRFNEGAVGDVGSAAGCRDG